MDPQQQQPPPPPDLIREAYASQLAFARVRIRNLEATLKLRSDELFFALERCRTLETQLHQERADAERLARFLEPKLAGVGEAPRPNVGEDASPAPTG